MRLAVKSLALALAISSPVDAKPARARASNRDARPATTLPHVTGVVREETLALPIGATASTASIDALPGELGFEIQLAVRREAVAATLDAVPAGWHVDVRDLDGGLRIRITHDKPGVSFASARLGQTLHVAFGVTDEQSRLRAFATRIRLPLPEPEDLGAELEVWQDAERRMASGDLPEAKRLWERLAEVPRLADLASLRIAELYVASGHINEAMSQLRGVSRLYPRSAGAALARLDVLHLEALTKLGEASIAQIDVAAAVVDRPGFDSFAHVRAAMVLRDMGRPDAALSRFPDAAPLPEIWRAEAESLRQDLVAESLIGPLLRGDPRGTAIAWSRWAAQAEGLDDRELVTDMVAEAHERLGLFDTALPLLQARLRTIASAAAEADLVGRVAHAYRMTADVERASFAIDFQLASHPDAPGLVEEIEAIAITRAVTDGLASARAWLAGARKRAASAGTSRAIDGIDDELVLGWGTPAQIVHSLAGVGGTATMGTSDGTTATSRSTDSAIANRNERALAVAMVRAGRHADAVPMLRNLAERSADPKERDRLSYYLGVAELELGHVDDATKIFRHISTHGTTFAQLAIARLQERRLTATVSVLAANEGGGTR